MRPKNKILLQFSLEQYKNGIIFYNSIPLFKRIENVAKQLQVEVWLEIPFLKGNPNAYIV